ncbi:MAG: beta-1,6-N-acetylglucosaminyltransferase [Pantoea dispersa]|uniref:beta-1,6-N-acetylglucosaminyltransferase n=1 Tax=Pantoea dispersa TaxID=59814 RepID=UPI002867841B|nr:beta-1,6-N-acetylglucosaminyltransferase [Pantoea dispersa]MDR6295886.1 hypothetical protein [Pantoea dispersa]
MRKVFCILCHKVTNPFLYTVNYLSSFNENTIIIHVDSKSSFSDFDVFKSNNVIFVKKRVEVSWGRYSQIESTLRVFNEALNFEFDYLFLISGDDIPCMTNESINDLLARIEMRNMIHYQDQRNNYVDPLSRVMYHYPEYFYARKKSFFEKVKIRAFCFIKTFYVSANFIKHSQKIDKFYKGTNWISLNRQTAHELMSFINTNPWYCELFRDSFCADEVFFHTALKQIGVDDNYHDETKLNDALRYIDWTTGPDYPRTLDTSDLDKIKASGCIFSRKISASIPYEFFEKLVQ